MHAAAGDQVRRRVEQGSRLRHVAQHAVGVEVGLGCTYVQAYQNRKHPEEWLMLQEWPDKATFDKFAERRGPELDREAGVRWTDVSTWTTSVFEAKGG